MPPGKHRVPVSVPCFAKRYWTNVTGHCLLYFCCNRGAKVWCAFVSCYLVNTLYSWSLFHEQKDLLECTMDSFLYIFSSFFSRASPEVFSESRTGIRASPPSMPVLPSMWSWNPNYPFSFRRSFWYGGDWVSVWRDVLEGILFSASPLLRIVYSGCTGPKCDHCCQFRYCPPRCHCFRYPIGN